MESVRCYCYYQITTSAIREERERQTQEDEEEEEEEDDEEEKEGMKSAAMKCCYNLSSGPGFSLVLRGAPPPAELRMLYLQGRKRRRGKDVGVSRLI